MKYGDDTDRVKFYRIIVSRRLFKHTSNFETWRKTPH
jgi:hypothetical protein